MVDDAPNWLPPVSALERVIPVVDERALPDGGRLIVASIEIWSDKVIVRYTLTAQDLMGDVRAAKTTMFDPRVLLADDVGTEYTSTGGSGGGGGDQLMHMVQPFTPALADGATKVVVFSAEIGTVEVDV